MIIEPTQAVELINIIKTNVGYVKEPDGVTLVVDKRELSIEMEEGIKDFIKKSKEKNKKLLEKLSLKK